MKCQCECNCDNTAEHSVVREFTHKVLRVCCECTFSSDRQPKAKDMQK